MATPKAKRHETPTTTPARPSKRLKRAQSASELNVEEVVLGDRLVRPSFGSLYREELVGTGALKRLYVCEGCFKYTGDAVAFVGHRRFCDYRTEVPGDIVYEAERYSILEVDGEDHHLFTQNLSLFAKLFIDTKSVCFDASSFLFYLLVDQHPSHISSSPPLSTHQDSHPQIVGFFSKEKLSWDNNNLACILVFPPWQKLGLGQMMMAASYELSKRDGRLGGPERPLSKAGAASYAVYWCRTVGKLLLERPRNEAVSVTEISEATCMIEGDVMEALAQMGVGSVMTGRKKGGSVIVDKMILRKWLRENGIDITKEVLDPDGFVELSEEEEESD